jgi:23S rRNA (adenine2030-N6)-methyltransferase
VLSYQHAYHAGNFADVMKHVVLTAILEYMTRKESKLCYIDTHAGAGSYDLGSAQARKTGESADGVARIWDADDAPANVASYLALVHGFNRSGKLVRYPGSPAIAAELLRRTDRLVLCEMHKAELAQLEKLFRTDRRVYCHGENSYRFGLGLVPPIERRGLVLMDPSFELADEYDTAVQAIVDMHTRFRTGTYALWYPLLNKHRSNSLREQLVASGIRDVLHLALNIAAPRPNSGMYGSAMIVINPPWTLARDMQEALPWLAGKLGMPGENGWDVAQWVDE